MKVIRRDYRPWAGAVYEGERSAEIRFRLSSRPVFSSQNLECSFEDLRGKNNSFLYIPTEIINPRDIMGAKEGAPVLIVTVSRTKGTLGGVIGLSVHHKVTDGSAQFSFMKCWCDEAKGISSPSNVEKIHDRNVLPRNPIVPSRPPKAYDSLFEIA